MKKIYTEIEINAPVGVVWEILMDLEKYSEWNPLMIKASGKVEVGESLMVTMQQPGSKPMTFRPIFKVVDPNKEMSWQGRLGGLPFLFIGDHYFALEELSSSTTKLKHGEQFRGLLLPFMSSMLKNTEKAFILMNQALKKRAESSRR